ncbi:MAG: MFS transporter, partial [Bacteriovoracales bacterium]
PLGSFLSGSIAQHLGIPWTLAISGLGCVITSLLFLKILPNFRFHVRPIYIKLGLLAAVVETPH